MPEQTTNENLAELQGFVNQYDPNEINDALKKYGLTMADIEAEFSGAVADFDKTSKEVSQERKGRRKNISGLIAESNVPVQMGKTQAVADILSSIGHVGRVARRVKGSMSDADRAFARIRQRKLEAQQRKQNKINQQVKVEEMLLDSATRDLTTAQGRLTAAKTKATAKSDIAGKGVDVAEAKGNVASTALKDIQSIMNIQQAEMERDERAKDLAATDSLKKWVAAGGTAYEWKRNHPEEANRYETMNKTVIESPAETRIRRRADAVKSLGDEANVSKVIAQIMKDATTVVSYDEARAKAVRQVDDAIKAEELRQQGLTQGDIENQFLLDQQISRSIQTTHDQPVGFDPVQAEQFDNEGGNPADFAKAEEPALQLFALSAPKLKKMYRLVKAVEKRVRTDSGRRKQVRGIISETIESKDPVIIDAVTEMVMRNFKPAAKAFGVAR